MRGVSCANEGLLRSRVTISSFALRLKVTTRDRATLGASARAYMKHLHRSTRVLPQPAGARSRYAPGGWQQNSRCDASSDWRSCSSIASCRVLGKLFCSDTLLLLVVECLVLWLSCIVLRRLRESGEANV